MKICIFKGKSNNSVLRTLADEMAHDAGSVGITVHVMDLNTLNATNIHTFREQLSDFEVVICFNGIGIELKDAGGEYVLNTIKATIVLWFVDDPAYYYDRLKIPLNKKVVLYPNTRHSSYIDLINPTTPHRPMLCGHPQYLKNIIKYENRKTSITVALSWHGLPEPFWEGIPNGNTRKTIEHTVAHIRDEPELYVYEVFDYYLKQISGVSIAELDVGRTISVAICSITDYFRKLDRLNLVKALGTSSAPINLVGNGWSDMCRAMPNIKLIQEVNYQDLQPLYQSSKIVINTNAANGGCERAFSALASGAYVLSDYSTYLESVTAGNPKIDFYNRSSEIEIAEKVSQLFEKMIHADATDTVEFNDEKHLWRNRMIEICEICIE
jgi:hypothetical protein